MALGQLAITPGYARATAGDDWAHVFTLWDNGAVKNVATASAISAAIQNMAGAVVVAETACASGATGAAWSTGQVALPFSASQTSGLIRNQYRIELQVTLGGVKTTWPLVPVEVQTGTIA